MRNDAALRLAYDVAAYLGAGWQATEAMLDDTAYLHGPEGRKFHIEPVRYKDQFEVRAVWPETDCVFGPGEYHAAINVSASKPGDRVAREIERRLMSRTDPVLERVLAWNARKASAASRRTVAAHRLSGLLPGGQAIKYGAKDHLDAVEWRPHSGPVGSLRIELSGSPDTVRVELSRLPLHLAERLCEWLAAETAVTVA